MTVHTPIQLTLDEPKDLSWQQRFDLSELISAALLFQTHSVIISYGVKVLEEEVQLK